MSSQKGNASRSRAQKHQNSFAFKNSVHDTSKRTKEINSINVTGCCMHCKEVIEWKIKYKKYKPLSQPKKCTKCQQKTVKKSYCILCDQCVKTHKICAKCGKDKELTSEPEPSQAEEVAQQCEFEEELKHLPERKRRTFLRLQEGDKFNEVDSLTGTDKQDEPASDDNMSNSSEDEEASDQSENKT